MKCKKNIKNVMAFTVLSITTMFFINTSFAANMGKVNVETANLRETADKEGKVLKQLSINTEVEVIEKTGDWYSVKSGDVTGYIRQDLLAVEEQNDNKQEESAQTVTEVTAQNNNENNEKATENNVEEKAESGKVEEPKEEKTKIVAENAKLKIVPAINATDIIEVKQGDEVEIIESINGWICIQSGTTKGWIREEKLKSKEKPVEEVKEEAEKQEEEQAQEQPAEKKIKTSYIGSETVNLRKEASTSSDVLARLSLNTSVDVYSEENGWCKVKYGAMEGYISSSLLSDTKKETSRGAETPRANSETTQSAQTAAVAPSAIGGTVVETAMNYIGSSYKYGASGPSSFDCSGFTSYIYAQHGVSLNRTAAGQYSNGVAVSRDQLQPGDLVMFGKSGINHVGIYIGGGQIVHAANPSRGVTTDTINSGYYNNNYVGARRVN